MKRIKKIIALNLAILLVLSMTIVSFASQSWPLLKQGSSGHNVNALQYLLTSHNYSIVIDGDFGSNTTNVVKSFQRAKGLSDDGIVGQNTWLKLIKTVRVGDYNNHAVRAVQYLLKYKYSYSISVDGDFGSGTKTVVKNFQSSCGLVADGIVGSNTWLYLLNDNDLTPDDFWSERKVTWTNPISKDDTYYHSPSGAFGASRDGGRAHAGLDFLSNVGTRVLAMTSGKVTNIYTFYLNSKAVEVLNDDGTVIRYCEISPDVSIGDYVQQGNQIGTVVWLTNSSMLHLEIYRGTSTGSLTQRDNSIYKYTPYKNYQRRSDLQDPTYATQLKRVY